MIYKNKINLEGKDRELITKILLESYQHPDTLYILLEDCSYLFYNSKNFKYIGNWDTSNVVNMQGMFSNSTFNGDISDWNVSNVKNMSYVFSYSEFNGNISKWDVSSVKSMNWIFKYSNFNKDISKWNISNNAKTDSMF